MNAFTTHPKPPSRLSRSELKVLLVDDDLLVLNIISEVLRNLGITHVTQANSGQQALEILSKKQQIFDLLLLDLHMPSMDGFAFMESIAQGVYNGPLIIVSGQRDVVVQAASMVARLSQFTLLGALQKPFRKAALAALISKLD
jgi:CheY-like chemotaxis protein